MPPSSSSSERGETGTTSKNSRASSDHTSRPSGSLARSTERTRRQESSIAQKVRDQKLRGVSLEKGPRSSFAKEIASQSLGVRSPSHKSLEKGSDHPSTLSSGSQKGAENPARSPSHHSLDKGVHRSDDHHSSTTHTGSTHSKSDSHTGRSPSHKSLEKGNRGSSNNEGTHLPQREYKLRSVTPPVAGGILDSSFPSRGANHRSKSLEKGVRTKPLDNPGPLSSALEASGLDKRSDRGEAPGQRQDRRIDAGTLAHGHDTHDRPPRLIEKKGSDKEGEKLARVDVGLKESASPDHRKGSDDSKQGGRLQAGRPSLLNNSNNTNIRDPIRESKEIDRTGHDLIINGSGTPLFHKGIVADN